MEVIDTTTTKLAKVSLEDVQSKHRKEKKELQAKIQDLKKNAPKSDKKKRKEVLEEISKIEAELDARQTEELKKAESELNEDGCEATQVDNQEVAINDNQVNNHKNDNVHGEDDDDDVVQCKQPQRVSKAQKRRDKKSREARQRDEDIKAAAEDAIHAPKAVETRKLIEKLQKRQLALHNIPSDGDCMYNAIRHQLLQHGLGTHNVPELRNETANYINANKESLIPYMTNPKTGDLLNDAEFVKYCDDVRNVAWGGQIELKAMSTILKVPIEVLQADGSPTIQGAEFGGAPLIITYHRHMYSLGEHYNSTVGLSQVGSEGELDDAN